VLQLQGVTGHIRVPEFAEIKTRNPEANVHPSSGLLHLYANPLELVPGAKAIGTVLEAAGTR
jgi:hypothetical protein